MSSIEIFREMRDTKNFIGVYPTDRLPLKVKYPSTLVINTDKASDPGEHWIAIHFYEHKFGEYFDSFGLPPLHDTITNFITRNSTNDYAYSTQTFQNLFSSACGAYCIMFVKMRNNGYAFCNILHEFGKDSFKNDAKATLIAKYMRTRNER